MKLLKLFNNKLSILCYPKALRIIFIINFQTMFQVLKKLCQWKMVEIIELILILEKFVTLMKFQIVFHRKLLILMESINLFKSKKTLKLRVNN